MTQKQMGSDGVVTDIVDLLFMGKAVSEAKYDLLLKANHVFVRVNSGFHEVESDILASIPPGMPVVLQVSEGANAKGQSESASLSRLLAEAVKKGGTLKAFPIAQIPAGHPGVAVPDYRTALDQLGLVPFGSLIPDFVAEFRGCITERLSKQIGLKIEFLEQLVDSGLPAGGEYFSGSVEFEGGSVLGSVTVSIPSETLRKLVSKMVGEEQVHVNEKVVDGLGEFVNIVAGGARGPLCAQGYGIRLASLPQVYSPDFQAMRGLEAAGAKSIERFQSTEGEIFLELNFLQ
jgi:CheY-specific phosphatase CheX